MRTRSPFRILPLHIIERILDYVTSSSRLLIEGNIKGSSMYTIMLAPLLTVCPEYTPLANAQMFRVHSMTLVNPSSPRCNMPSYRLGSHEQDRARARLYTKNLVIYLDMLDVCSGDALEWLLCEPYVGLEFPKARSATFCFFMPRSLAELEASEITSPDTELNINAFVRRVRQVAPMAKEISISLIASRSDDTRFPIDLLGSLVSQLGQHAVDLDYKFGYQPAIVDLQLCGLRRLTYCSLDATDDGQRIMQLVRNNAATLQVLELSVHAFTDMAGLIRCPDGSYVQYPCLQTLRLQDQPGVDAPHMLEFPGAVPFPSLRRLALDRGFYFSDDTVFRGNSATLEYLSLNLSSHVTMILRNHRVFAPLSHPKLHYVDIAVDDDSEPGLFETEIDFLRFMMSIGPSAPARTIRGALGVTEIQSAIPVFGEYACIQVLRLTSVKLNLWDAIALIKALPLLSDLHAPFPDLGPLPRGVAKHKLPAYVIANYAPTGKRFRRWVCESGSGSTIKKIVRCVLLLALVCPNFDYAAVDITNRDTVMAHMKRMITTDGFRPHALRLRRLLFGGYENEIPSLKTIRQRMEQYARRRHQQIE